MGRDEFTKDTREALSEGRCPECGCSLAPLDVEAHALNHWPMNIAPYPQHQEAILRRDMMITYARERR